MKTKRKKTITSTTKRWNDVDLVEVFERGKKEGARLQKETVKEALLKMRNKIKKTNSTNPDNNAIIIRGEVEDIINETAKELGIDLSQQRGVSSEKGEVLAKTNLAKTPYPVDNYNQDLEDKK